MERLLFAALLPLREKLAKYQRMLAFLSEHSSSAVVQLVWRHSISNTIKRGRYSIVESSALAKPQQGRTAQDSKGCRDLRQI